MSCWTNSGLSNRRRTSSRPPTWAIAARTTRPSGTARRTGRRGRAGSTGSRPGIRCWSGILPSRSGSSAARSTPRTTASNRHLETRGSKTALIWEGEPGDVRRYTYRELHEEVGRFANALKGLGVGKGDRVAIYLPMVPEAAVAMLACARIGAPHSVVFGGFSPQSLRDRIEDAHATCVITADGGYRRGGIIPLKASTGRGHRGSRLREERRRRAALRRDRPRGGAPRRPRGHAVLRDDRGPGSLVPRVDRRGGHRLSRRADGFGGPALHPLHLRDDGEAEGRDAHDRRLHDARDRDREVGVRPQGGRHLLVHGGRGLGDGPLLHRVRPARERGDGGDVRGDRRTGPTGAASGTCASATR